MQKLKSLQFTMKISIKISHDYLLISFEQNDYWAIDDYHTLVY